LHEQKIELLERLGRAWKKASLFPSCRWSKTHVRVGRTVIDLKQESAKEIFQLPEGETWLAATSACVPVQVTQEHLVAGSKEALDLASALWLAWSREDELHLEVDSDLFEMPGSEVRAVVTVEDRGNSTDLPVRVALAPDPLTQGKRSTERGGRVKGEVVPCHRTAVVIDHDGEPRSSSYVVLSYQQHIQLRVIYLP